MAPPSDGLARPSELCGQAKGNPLSAVEAGAREQGEHVTPDQRFSYRSLEELLAEIQRRGLDLPASDDISILGTPVRYGRLTVRNRLVVQPMEGCDGTADGAPTDLTIRRYERFAAGGAGMIWFEATAVVLEGRANPRQLWLHDGSAGGFERVLAAARSAARSAVGYEPVFILQMTHSGRYSRPAKRPAPIIAHHSAVLDPVHKLPPDYPLITDGDLDALQDAFRKAALLAAEAGFDAVDIKSCHRYLLSEMLASFTREHSRYGGSYENRTRMLRELAATLRQELGGAIEVTTRLNVHDAIAYPYGWGVDRDDFTRPDLAEPIRLIGELAAGGMGGVNVTAGNPYFNPHVNRPADWLIAGWPDPPEDPLTGVARLVHLARAVQLAHPQLAVVGSGYTWLRQYFPQFAAGAVRAGWASLVGLGRGALAYPDFAKDILASGRMDPQKVCIACSSCTQIMRDGGRAGCVIRDHEVYAPIFRAGRTGDPQVTRQLASQCRRCVDAGCTSRCPAGVDIPGFLAAAAEGRDEEAYRILRNGNILAGVCGAVCPVEVQCQSGCIQNHIGQGPVAIAEVQLALAQRAIEAGWAALRVPDHCSGHRAAVVGAGPAGLAAAAELILRGHRVTIFNRGTRPGGKLDGIIPPGRLSYQQAAAEIHALFDAVPPDRLEWRFGAALGPALTLDALFAQGFQAVLLAMGLSGETALTDQAGRRPDGAVEAGEFLRQMSRDPARRCPARVVVIGGGNTAADAAVCAIDRGAEDVYLVYRRSYRQMPAWPRQRDEALRAGAHLMLLCRPVGYVSGPEGRLAGVRLVRTDLAAPGADGRRRPVDVPDSQFILATDMAIEAIGESLPPDMARWLGGVTITSDGLIRVDELTLATDRPGVWAAGDIISGGATVVRAVAEGRRAAGQIGVHLSNLPTSGK